MHSFNDLSNDNALNHLEYWQTRLIDLPILALPTDRLHPATQSYTINSQSFTLSPDLTQELHKISEQHQVTLFMTLLAIFQVLLHRYSHQEDIVVGIPVKQNFLVLRTDLSGNPDFTKLITQVKDVTLKAYEHQDVAFETLIKVLNIPSDSSRHPLFQVLFALHEFNDEVGLNSAFDLSLECYETHQGLVGRVSYATDLFNASTIQRLIEHFKTLTAGVINNTTACIAELPLITEAERHQLVFEWNQTTTELPKARFVQQLFEEQVTKTPNAVAVVYQDQQLTYSELNHKANQVAHYLRQLGVLPNTLVGICVTRSLDQVIALLGVLKSGGAYIPLEQSYPRERLNFMLHNNHPAALLTQRHLDGLFDNIEIPIIHLDDTTAAWTTQSTENLTPDSIGLTPDHLAYVMYTSGSTGKPKGACVLHRNLHNQLSWYVNETELTTGDTVLALTCYAYALTQRVTYAPLLSGATLVLAPEPFDPQSIVSLIKQQQITLINLTASGFQSLVSVCHDDELRSLKKVFTAGEPLKIGSLLTIPEPYPQFINNYGATECAAAVMYHRVTKADIETYRDKIMPIGKPIWNCRIYLLDQYKQLVPVGVVGEIYIAGLPVGGGYIGQPELTEKAFFDNPFFDGRMFKTGDLGRRLENGVIEFLGRSDFQIKIRGFRIELGEIEAALQQHPQIRDVVVDVYEPIPNEKRLVAYIVAQGIAPNSLELKDFLKPKLPEFMLPSTYIFLDAMPMSANGKLNRKGLPNPKSISSVKKHNIPHNEIERELLMIWQQQLGITKIATDENFFDLGGHSLMAVKILNDIEKQFDVKLSLSALQQASTIEKLAAIIASEHHQFSWYSLVPVQPQGSRPPLFAIHTITMRDLPRYLGKEQPLYFLRYGMATETHNPPLKLPYLKELASHYIKEMQQLQPQGPYHIMGFSFGGLIAYEMACQLKANGHQVNFLGLLDSYLRREKLPVPHSQKIRKLLSHSFYEMFVWLKNKIRDKLTHQEQDTSFFPYTYTAAPDIECRKGYQPEIYPDQVILFQGDEWGSIFHTYEQPEQAWRELLGDKLKIEQVTGDHFEICQEPHAKLLAERITACMNESIKITV